jgi:phosphoribosyl 1,2-cyclic phosphodiesterase/anti-anti-sigma regulatory factor
VRGSIPTPLSTEQLRDKLSRALSGAAGVNVADPAEVQAYIAGLPAAVNSVVGGNTTCVEVDTGSDTIIIDCGSGMRQLGLHLMSRDFGKGKGTAHIFLTHAHWDHLQGFPFFIPAYIPGNKLIFYAVNYNPQHYLEHQQVAPMFFPIPPSAMSADKQFVQLREGETVQIGRMVVSSLALYHPGTAYAYRFDDGESVFVFASDGEYKLLTEPNLRRYIDFYMNADALVFDSQFSLRDVLFNRADWGHSSAIIGVDIAERARVKRLITFHHEPTHSDDQIYQIADNAREYAQVNEIQFNTEVIVGTEGLELFLGEAPRLEMLEQRNGSTWSLALAGHLNQNSTESARARLEALLTQAPSGRLLLDLTLLATVDAIGAKDIIETARAHPQARLAVLAPAKHIRRTLEQSGAAEALHLFRNRQQALTALIGPKHLRLASETIGGVYQIRELLFADETGVVYLGQDRSDEAEVLVNVVAGKAGEAVRETFLGRAEAWRRVRYPALLPVKTVVKDETWAAIVCAKPEGRSLRDWRAAKPEWKELWLTVERLCHTVAVLHAEGLVHGELSPEHIVTEALGIRLSRMLLFEYPPGFGPTSYRAPEQLRGQPIGPDTDVYLLGLILYEVLLGAPAFAAESEELRLSLQLHSQPHSPRAHWPEIPEELEALLLKMLAHSPADRHATAREVADSIAAISRKIFPRRSTGLLS